MEGVDGRDYSGISNTAVPLNTLNLRDSRHQHEADSE